MSPRPLSLEELAQRRNRLAELRTEITRLAGLRTEAKTIERELIEGVAVPRRGVLDGQLSLDDRAEMAEVAAEVVEHNRKEHLRGLILDALVHEPRKYGEIYVFCCKNMTGMHRQPERVEINTLLLQMVESQAIDLDEASGLYAVHVPAPKKRGRR